MQHQSLQRSEIATNAPILSHPLLCNDDLFFFEASKSNCQLLKKTINEFCSHSGEMINLQKSYKLFSPITPLELKEAIKENMGIHDKEE